MILNQRMTWSRDLLNFTECERCFLNLVHQYLMQIEENAPVHNQEQPIFIQLQQVFGQLGAIVMTPEAQVKHLTQRAEQLLSQYFPRYESYSLPEPLKHWFKHQISLLMYRSKVSFPCFSFHVEQAGRQLLVRLSSSQIKEQYLILLEEQELKSFSISDLELLGLTKREAEVLFWTAKDRSNAGIAKVLGCCEGTVRKHLEHIYAKLGVQTRTAAVMFALEGLGLLRESIVAISS